MKSSRRSKSMPWPRAWETRKPHHFMMPLEQIDPVPRTIRRRVGKVDVPRSWQCDVQLTCVLAGTGHIQKQGRRHELSPGSLFFFPPYERHAFFSEDDGFDIVIALFDLSPKVPGSPLDKRNSQPDAYAYDVTFPRGLSLPTHVGYPPGSQACVLAQEMVQAHHQGDVLGRYRAKILLHRLLLMALEHQARDLARNPRNRGGMTASQMRLEKTLAYIAQHCHQEMDIAELAARTQLSVSHFIRTFRLWVGMTPADHIHQLRIEQARRLLADAELSIKQIARQVGYADPYHFSRVFRRVAGMAPSDYRQAVMLRVEDAQR